MVINNVSPIRPDRAFVSCNKSGHYALRMFRFPFDTPEAFQQMQKYSTVVDTVQEPLACFFDFSSEGNGFPACWVLKKCSGSQQGVAVLLHIIHEPVQIIDTSHSCKIGIMMPSQATENTSDILACLQNGFFRFYGYGQIADELLPAFFRHEEVGCAHPSGTSVSL